MSKLGEQRQPEECAILESLRNHVRAPGVAYEDRQIGIELTGSAAVD